MLVGSNDRAIDIVNGPVDLARGIGLLLHGLKETLPDTRFAPAIETAGHSAPRTIAFRQIAPRGTGAQHPQDAVEDASMIQSRSTRFRFLRWKQRLEPLPLRVGEFFAFHTGECTPPARVCKHALVTGAIIYTGGGNKNITGALLSGSSVTADVIGGNATILNCSAATTNASQN